MSETPYPCPVTTCERAFGTAQGLAVHLVRTHPEYVPDVGPDLAEGQNADVDIEINITFTADEIVVLQALSFLRGEDINDLAVAAFNDLLTWAGAQEGVTTLLDLRTAWMGALVAEPDGATLSVVEDPDGNGDDDAAVES